MYKQVHIDGIETYLFLTEELEDILRDSSKPDEFQRCIMWHRKCVGEIENIKDVKLYPAVCHIEKADRWMPVYCLEMGKIYYHVGFRERWRCRDCGTEYGPVLLHQMEVDTVLYIGRKWPQIPKFFTKQYCRKCGHMLQGHLFMLSKKE